MINKEVLQFIIIGILNTVFYYILYSCFIYFGIDYRLSVLFATLIGVLFSFKTFGKYVFKNEKKRLIYKFFLVYLLLYIINIGLISIIQGIVLDYYISGMISTLFCAIISFILNKFYVFKEKGLKNG